MLRRIYDWCIEAAHKPHALWIMSSVLGGLLGYAIGALLYDSLGHWLIELYGLGGKVEAFRASYAEWGAVIILLKGLTPIPYKLVTITSGFAGYNLVLFVLCSIIARGGRFFVAAILLNRYGEWIRLRIERNLSAQSRKLTGLYMIHYGGLLIEEASLTA